MRRYWWLYLIALAMLLMIGVLSYQKEKTFTERTTIDEKIVVGVDSITRCAQIIVIQNDSILNALQDQLILDSVNNHELQSLRQELIKSNKRNSK